jgi:hypothetical protein
MPAEPHPDPAGEQIRHHEAHVVPMLRVLGPGITQTHDEPRRVVLRHAAHPSVDESGSALGAAAFLDRAQEL